MTGNQALSAFNSWFNNIKIDIIKYTLYSNSWWCGQYAIVLKSQRNLDGQIIRKGTTVRIIDKMQTIRFGKPLHNGMFSIQDEYNTVIIGVDCEDLLLKY